MDEEPTPLPEKLVPTAVVALVAEPGVEAAAAASALMSILAQLGPSRRRTILVGGGGALAALGIESSPRRAGGVMKAMADGATQALDREAIEVVVLVSPALASWSAEERAHVDPRALALVARFAGAAGWLAMADGDAPVREGLLLVSADLWRQRSKKFADAESWSDLVSLIRLTGVPIFDLRALRRVGELGLSAADTPIRLAAGLTRALARMAGFAHEVDPRFKLDDRHLPWSVRHGDAVRASVSGWVALLPQATEVRLVVAGRELPIAVDQSRPDVLLSFPDLADDRCGFRFDDLLPPLPPGIHPVTVVVPPDRGSRRLGTVRVLPRFELAIDRLVLPTSFAADRGLPVFASGRVVVTHPPVRLEARLDDSRLEVELEPIVSDAGSTLPSEIGFRVSDCLRVDPAAPRHRLWLRAFDARGRSIEQSHDFAVEAGADLSLALFERRIEARDARTGRCRVRVRGALYDCSPGDVVGLQVDGVATAVAAVTMASSGRHPVGDFDLDLEAALAAGDHRLSLSTVGSGAPRQLASWSATVVECQPRLDLSRCLVEAAAFGGRTVLTLAGELTHANAVDSLRLTLDGRFLIDVDPRSFTPAPGDGALERRAFRIAYEVDLSDRPHELRLEAVRAQKVVAAWRQELGGAATGRTSPELVSGDLDRLRRHSPSQIWSTLRIAGQVRGAAPDAEVVLELDGSEAARVAIDHDGSFLLRETLAPCAARSVAVAVVRGVERLVSTPTFDVQVRRIAIPPPLIDDLDQIRTVLGDANRALDGLSSDELLRGAVGMAFEEFGEISMAVSALAARVRSSRERPGRLIEPPPRLERRLRVLWFSWEIPWSGHGGGVSIVNWLEHLGARHEITLVHPVYAGGEGLSEEVRERVGAILTVPRDWRPAAVPAPFGVPAPLLATYTPALSGLLAAELASGRYDLANFEFAGGYLHLAKAPVPSLLVHHEVASFALAAEARGGFRNVAAGADWLRRMIAALYFDTVRLPERCDRLVTLTEPEARFLAPFLPGAELLANPIPIDIDDYDRRSESVAGPQTPTFVFVGTFRHSPNREAAARIVDRLAPELRRRLPEARIVLAGANPPAELVERAQRAGVDCLGFVDDLAQLYAGATATLAPIASGGGMRVKLLEAMACGCPVITTGLGINGIAAVPGEDFLLAERDEEFVDAAVGLALEPERRRALIAGGRELLRRQHSIAVQGERRERIWAATLAARAQPSG